MSAKPDLLYAALKAQVGREGTIPDLWKAYLEGLGFAGAFPDMAAKHASVLGISVQDYYNTDGSIFAGGGSITAVEFSPVSFSQSSNTSGLLATTSNMADANGNGDTVTGAATASELNAWIKADLGSSKYITSVRLGCGNLSGFGTIGPNLNTSSIFIEVSADDTNWTRLKRTTGTMTDSATADRDIDFHFSPVTARYIRIYHSGTGFVPTATFRVFGYTSDLTRETGIVYTQSSVLNGLTATEASLNELPHVSTTGAATNTGSPAWIVADIGAVKNVEYVVLAGGNMTNFGNTATSIIGRTVEISSDGSFYEAVGTLPNEIYDSAPTEIAFPILTQCRYIRVSTSGSVVATTAFRVYTRP